MLSSNMVTMTQVWSISSHPIFSSNLCRSTQPTKTSFFHLLGSKQDIAGMYTRGGGGGGGGGGHWDSPQLEHNPSQVNKSALTSENKNSPTPLPRIKFCEYITRVYKFELFQYFSMDVQYAFSREVCTFVSVF